MSDKIIFNWSLFSDVDLQLSETEKIVIEEHFNIWVEGNSGIDDCSSPEMKEKFSIFKAAWIMSQMFTN
ncbi:MAG: hypothetical protein ACTSRU_18070 [Candidatus Hodarchaeales archaeon]